MYNGHRLLIVYFILIGLIKIEAALPTKSPYYCDAKEIESVRNPNIVSRFAIKKDTVYLILKKKIISFRLYGIEKHDETALYYNTSQPFFLMHDDNPYSNKDFKLKGYDVKWTQSDIRGDIFKIKEIYQHKSHSTNKTFLHTLDFDKIPCLRGDIEITSVYPLISNYSLRYENNHFEIKFIYDQRNLDIKLTNIDSKNVSIYKTELDYDVLFAQFYAKPSEYSNNYLIELDSQNNLHINQLDIKNLSYINDLFKMQMPLDKFFSCHQPLDDFKQLKGIYYDEQSNSFYIFIDRFYIVMKTDLVKSNFQINQNKLIFFKNAFDLVVKGVKDPIFDHSNSKWIKSFKDDVFLDLWNSGQFKIFIKDEPAIKLLGVSNDLIKKCRRQILQVNQHFYCINEKTYYSMNKSIAKPDVELEMHNIKDLFDSTPIEYESHQTVECIFNYKENTFVLMTQTHLFIIEYSVVDVDKNQNLIFKYDKTKIFRKIKNCILPEDKSQCNNDEPPGPNRNVIINLGFQLMSYFLVAALALTIFIGCMLLQNKKKNVYVFKTRESKGIDSRRLNNMLDEASTSRSHLEASPESTASNQFESKADKFNKSSKFIGSKSKQKDKFFVVRMT